MKEKISRTLSKITSDIPKASSQSSSATDASPRPATIGDPNCPHCHGIGYLRYDVPVGHEKFGRAYPCTCRSADIAEGARTRLFELSRLDRLSHLTFENFESRGNRNAKFITPQDILSLQSALEAAQNFARQPQGWLLLEGGYGCGKTHLAAAIANFAVSQGKPTLFITVPDLLDMLRSGYNDPESSFQTRFEEVRNADLLVLDDFGTQNATPWAQEKLFQIINFRYINKLPTVITTNLMLDEIESRIRSRLQDEIFVHHIRITSPDFRRPTETSNPGISMLSLPEVQAMTFKSFETRENELGSEVTTTTTVDRKDRYGHDVKVKEITRQKVTSDDVKSLRKAVNAAVSFAEEPHGWLVLMGQSFSGKTHLGAAIGNYRIDLGGQAIMANLTELLDYLKQTFNESAVTYDRRMYEIKTTPMLILDDLRESGSLSNWGEDRLHQILNHRYYAQLPTVITTSLNTAEFAVNYPSLWNRILDAAHSQSCAIDMPPYRRMAKGRSAHKKGK